VFEAIVKKCKDHLLENKDEIERYDLDSSDLKNFNPLYWKKEKGKVVEGQGPVLYIKAMMSKKNEKITTMFINEETNEEMSAYDLMERYCFIKGALKFESIFIGNKISLQLKLYEALVKPMDMERRTLLRSNVVRRVETTESSDIFDALDGSSNSPTSETRTSSPTQKATKTTPTPSTTGSLNEDDSTSSDEEEESEEEEEEEEVAESCPVGAPCPAPAPTPTPTATPTPVKKIAATTTRKSRSKTVTA
jgi:hypothetical protein